MLNDADDDDDEYGVTLITEDTFLAIDSIFNSEFGGNINIDDDDDEEEELEIERGVFSFTTSKVVTLSIPIVANELLMFAFFFCRNNADVMIRLLLASSLNIRCFCLRPTILSL